MLDDSGAPYAVFSYDAHTTTCRMWSILLDDALPTVPLRLAANLAINVNLQDAMEQAWFAGGYSQNMNGYRSAKLPNDFTPDE